MVVPLQTKSGAFLARQAAKYAADSAYQLSRMKKLPGLANGITSVLKRNAYIQGEVAKPVAEFVKRIPGKGDAASKAAAAGSTLGGLVAIGGVAIIVAIQAILQGIINSSTFKNFDYVNGELQKSFDRYQKNVIAIRGVEAQVKQFKQEDQRTRDRIYAIEKQQPKIREDANNALYETRQGRKILEAKIAKAEITSNNNLYESRQTATRIDARIKQLQLDFNKFLGNASNNFQASIASTIANIQASLNVARSQVAEGQKQISSLNTIVNGLQTKINQATQIKIPSVADVVNQVTPTIKLAVSGEFTELKNQIGTLRISNDLLRQQDTVLAGGIKNVATEIRIVDGKIEQIKRSPILPVVETPPEVKRNLDQLKTDIDKLQVKIKERENVDKDVNRKLDQYLPLLGAIPLIPGRVADNLRPNLLTSPQIEQATGNAICKSLNGGCGKASVDDAVNRVNTNNNNNAGSVLDAVNAGLNTADLALLGVINNKLGDQLPGGIGGKLDRVAKWLHLDRALNILIWWQTLHNAYMLSANLGQTLTSAISNVLAAIGIKDAEGNPLDIGTILGGQFDNLAKTVIGESEWGSIKAEYKKWNRIYQAAANLMNSIQSIGYSILSALEVVGSWVASIGNALRRWGEVGETAYRWMNPTPNFQNKFFTTLENVENVVSQVDQVASEVLSVQETVTQIGQQKDEFTKALGQEPESKQSTTPPEAIQVKAGFDASKLVSVTGLAISDEDKEADE